mgnify:CR=1 FL=1
MIVRLFAGRKKKNETNYVYVKWIESNKLLFFLSFCLSVSTLKDSQHTGCLYCIHTFEAFLIIITISNNFDRKQNKKNFAPFCFLLLLIPENYQCVCVCLCLFRHRAWWILSIIIIIMMKVLFHLVCVFSNRFYLPEFPLHASSLVCLCVCVWTWANHQINIFN